MPKAAPDPTAPRLPDGIEVFRAGTRTSDDGTVYTITPSDLAASAAAYSAAVHEAPLTVGHPKDNLPAYGWVSGLQLDGDVLKTCHRAVEPAFAEMVAAERFKKRSASFYHPRDPANPKPGVWYLRHVAWLGAQPPAVKGLKDVQFSAGDAGGVVSFSEPITATTHQLEPTDMSKELEEQLAKAKKETEAAQAAAAAAHAAADEANKKAAAAQAQAASFAEKARADRKAGFVSFADAQVKAGTLLPKDKDMAVATLEALADSKPVEFAEGDTTRKVSPAQWLQDLIAGAKPQVSFGEFAGGRAPDAAGAAKGKTDAEIHQAAQAWMASHKGVSYAEALGAVTSATFTG